MATIETGDLEVDFEDAGECIVFDHVGHFPSRSRDSHKVVNERHRP